MARVHTRAVAASHPSSATSTVGTRRKRHDKAAATSQHGVKLRKRAILSATNTQPPENYTFLSVGYPDLINKCKELSQEKGVQLRVVTASGRVDDTMIASQLHRVGYHIRTDIFDEACTWLDYHLENGKLVQRTAPDPTEGFERIFERYGADMNQLGAPKLTAKQEESRKVKSVIREMFPLVPEDSVDAIFDTAWQQGATTVGNAMNLPLARRVQLAVVAHIRHRHTDYDWLIRRIGWDKAREAVEQTCLDKLAEWRGESIEDDEMMEGIMNEVIVISDDDSAAERSEPENYADNEDSSEPTFEISHRVANAADLEGSPSAFGDFSDNNMSTRHVQPTYNAHRQDRFRSALTSRWRDARERVRRAAQSGQSQQGVTPLPPLGPPVGEIQTTKDHTGRVPDAFFRDGVEYIQINPEDVQGPQPGRLPSYQNTNDTPYSHPTRTFEVQSVLTGGPVQPTAFPAVPLATASTVGSQHQPPPHPSHVEINGQLYSLVPQPVQDLPPQRFFDDQGREVLLDPAHHQLVPAPMPPLPTTLPTSPTDGRPSAIQLYSASRSSQIPQFSAVQNLAQGHQAQTLAYSGSSRHSSTMLPPPPPPSHFPPPPPSSNFAPPLAGRPRAQGYVESIADDSDYQRPEGGNTRHMSGRGIKRKSQDRRSSLSYNEGNRRAHSRARQYSPETISSEFSSDDEYDPDRPVVDLTSDRAPNRRYSVTRTYRPAVMPTVQPGQHKNQTHTYGTGTTMAPSYRDNHPISTHPALSSLPGQFHAGAYLQQYPPAQATSSRQPEPSNSIYNSYRR